MHRRRSFSSLPASLSLTSRDGPKHKYSRASHTQQVRSSISEGDTSLTDAVAATRRIHEFTIVHPEEARKHNTAIGATNLSAADARSQGQLPV